MRGLVEALLGKRMVWLELEDVLEFGRGPLVAALVQGDEAGLVVFLQNGLSAGGAVALAHVDPCVGCGGKGAHEEDDG